MALRLAINSGFFSNPQRNRLANTSSPLPHIHSMMSRSTTLDFLAGISLFLCALITRLFHRCLRLLDFFALPTRLAPAIFLHVSLASASVTHHVAVDTVVAFASSLRAFALGHECSNLHGLCACVQDHLCPSHVDQYCTKICACQQTFRIEQRVLFQRGFLQSLQHDTDTDSCSCGATSYCVNSRSKASTRANKSPENSKFNRFNRTSAKRILKRRSERDAASTSPGPALTTWSSEAARRVITKMNASCFLASSAAFAHKRCIDVWSSVAAALVINPASPS